MSEGPGPAALLAGLAGGLRRRSPAIVVLEDLHWADEATLDFLRFAGRRIEEVPALVIGTFRDEELDRAASAADRPRRPWRGKTVRLRVEPSLRGGGLDPRARGGISTPMRFTAAQAETRSS